MYYNNSITISCYQLRIFIIFNSTCNKVLWVWRFNWHIELKTYSIYIREILNTHPQLVLLDNEKASNMTCVVG